MRHLEEICENGNWLTGLVSVQEDVWPVKKSAIFSKIGSEGKRRMAQTKSTKYASFCKTLLRGASGNFRPTYHCASRRTSSIPYPMDLANVS